jgi:hypothetical protein
MINTIILKKIIQLLSQAYALPPDEVYAVYSSLNSLDSLLEIIDIANRNNWTIEKARENWMLNDRQA